MHEIQKISLEILKKIIPVCEANNFRYTLAFGTLIGMGHRTKRFFQWSGKMGERF